MLLALAGVGMVGWLFMAVFLNISDDVADLHRFGRFGDGGALVIQDAAEVTVFLEPQSRSMSGVRFEVIDVATGFPVPTRAASSSFSYDFPSGSGRSIAAVDLEPGEYVVTVEPADATVAIGPSPAPTFGDFALGLLVGLPLIAVGGTLAVVSAVRQTRERTQAASFAQTGLDGAAPAAASPWATGAWDHGGSSLPPPPTAVEDGASDRGPDGDVSAEDTSGGR